MNRLTPGQKKLFDNFEEILIKDKGFIEFIKKIAQIEFGGEKQQNICLNK